jgi:pimeloyl-ACP methyl ester carboxylesterase
MLGLRRLPLLATAGVLALTPAAASAARPPEGPKGTAFYRASKRALKGAHGTLIRARRISTKGLPLPQAGRRYLVLYRSRLPDGTATAVSGTITIPSGRAPKGGFPTVAWAHGTTGIADVCAPTRLYAKAGATDAYRASQRAQQTEWVRRGWAVTDTDYQGLGTPGMHPYLIGLSEGRSVIDSVLAARALSAKVGRRWATIGHSQGGHAALWAAALAGGWAPSLRLRGVAPIAPANHVGEQGELLSRLPSNPFGALPALIVAAAAKQLVLAPADVFSARALAQYPLIEERCDLDAAFAPIPLSEFFNPALDPKVITDFLQRNDPEDLEVPVPVLVTQGTADRTVLPSFTDQLVADYQARGIRVTYTKLDGVDHTGAAAASRAADLAFLERLLG